MGKLLGGAAGTEPEVPRIVDLPSEKRAGAASFLALLTSAAILATAVLPGPVQAADVGVGAGIFYVDGTMAQNVSLPLGGTYYLSVATDSGAAFVNATLTYNGTLMAEQNTSSRSSTFASLPAGDYSLALAGHGRAALGWDFTNGAVQDFPDNASLVAFLAPSGPKVVVYVSRGNAQTLALSVYSDNLLPVANATVSSDGPVTFILPASSSSVAYLVARVTAGAPNGIYGLSWTSGPVNSPLDFTTWPLFLVWIVVPVAVTLVVFVVLQRRRMR